MPAAVEDEEIAGARSKDLVAAALEMRPRALFTAQLVDAIRTAVQTGRSVQAQLSAAVGKDHRDVEAHERSAIEPRRQQARARPAEHLVLVVEREEIAGKEGPDGRRKE